MDPILTNSGDTQCLSEFKSDLDLDGDAPSLEARDFARLVPVSSSAKKAFSTIARLITRDHKWLKHERNFLHINQNSLDSVNPTGHYRFNLSILPRRLGRGWILGCGQAQNCDSGIDLVLTLTGECDDVRAQHAQIYHHPETTLLMLAPGPGKTIFLNGTELAGSQAKTVLPSATFAITLGNLTYRFEFDQRATSSYSIQLRGLMSERNALFDSLPRSLDPTPRPNHFILCGYQFQTPLAGGAFGVVSACVKLATGDVFAAKRVQRTQQTRISVNRELEVLKRLDSHPHVCTLVDMFYSDGDQYSMGSREMNDIYLIMQPWAPMTLDTILRTPSLNLLLTLQTAATILRQILLGLQHLHTSGVIHRDIKLCNILVVHVNPMLKIVIADMGASTIESSSRDHMKGTILYLPPEILALKYGWKSTIKAGHWSGRSDIFSAGLVGIQLRNKDRYDGFYENFGNAKYVDQALHQQLRADLQRPLTMQHGSKAEHSSFTSGDLDIALLEMITWDAEHRPTASDVLQSRFWRQSNKRAKSG